MSLGPLGTTSNGRPPVVTGVTVSTTVQYGEERRGLGVSGQVDTVLGSVVLAPGREVSAVTLGTLRVHGRFRRRRRRPGLLTTLVPLPESVESASATVAPLRTSIVLPLSGRTTAISVPVYGSLSHSPSVVTTIPSPNKSHHALDTQSVGARTTGERVTTYYVITPDLGEIVSGGIGVLGSPPVENILECLK